MEYTFTITKSFDNGQSEIISEGVSENYIGEFAKVVAERMDTDPKRIVRRMTNYGRGYFGYRVWDYSYTMQITKK